MREKKGSMITQPPFEVIIAVVFMFLIIGFVIAQSGGIQGVLDMICDKVPELCGGKYSTVDYETAKQSKEMLKCGVDSTFSGEEQCAEVVTTNIQLAGAATSVSEEFETIEYETDYRTSGIGPSDEEMAEKCEEECEKKTPQCDCISCTHKVISSRGGSGYVGTGSDKFKVTCNVINEGDEASIFCNFEKGYPVLEYEEDRNLLKSLGSKAFNVFYWIDSGEWKWKSYVLGGGADEFKPLSEMTLILNKLDGVHTYIHENLMKVNKGKGENDEKYKKGLEVLRDAVLSDKYGKDDEIIIYHKNGETEILDKTNINKILTMELENNAICKVFNFNLPESFGGGLFNPDTWKEYINGFGDPSFLVYYQFFPLGEDGDWNSQSEWFAGVGKIMFAAMCIADIARPLLKIRKIAKTAVKNGVTRMKNSVKNLKNSKQVEATITEAEKLALAPELVGKVQGAEILATMKRANMNKAIVDYFKRRNPGEAAGAVYRKATEPVRTAPGGWEGLVGENYAQMGREFETVFNGGYSNADLSKILLDKSNPGIMENLMKKTIEKAKSPEMLARVAKYVGIDYGLSYYAARFDSELGKFIKQHSNSLVLGIPLVREEAETLFKNEIPKSSTIYYPDKQNLVNLGKPVILIKKEWGNEPTPFYLASPCKAHLTIESKPVTCGVYSYDSLSGLTTCDNPNKDSDWSKKLKSGKLQECGSLLVGDEDIFNFYKDTAKNMVESIEDAEVYGGESTLNTSQGDLNRIKIVDPIDNIVFYYDKDNNVIDWIGANIWMGGDVYKWQIKSVEYYLEAAKKEGRKTCWLINSKEDGRELCFRPDWDSPGRSKIGIEWIDMPTFIITTGNGTKGFACREHEIGKYPRESSFGGGTLYYEDEKEKFVMGKGEIPDDKKYFTCNGPIVDDNIKHYSTDFKIYFDDGTNEFYAIHIKKTDDDFFDRYDFVLKDSNYDSNIDEFGHYFLDIGLDKHFEFSESSKYPEMYFQYRIFMDKDFNGNVDAVVSTNCLVPGSVMIEADKTGKDEYGNNYCYQQESGTWNVVSTVLLFGASAFGKSGGGMLAAMAIDCGIAIAELKGVGQSKWPKG